jgi:hypothetical protein
MWGKSYGSLVLQGIAQRSWTAFLAPQEL